MAGCELNVAHAFVSAPSAHRLRHDVIVTSADDFDASRRRRYDDDDAEADRVGVIPHYRLVPSAFGPAVGGEWVTLSKSVLLQLVERICQLSFQADALPTTAACPSPADRRDNSAEISMDAVESMDALSSVVEAEQLDCVLPSSSTSSLSGTTAIDAGATAASAAVAMTSNTDGALMAKDEGPGHFDDVSASSDDGRELNVDATTEKVILDDIVDGGEDSYVFAEPVAMQEEDEKSNKSASFTETAVSDVADAAGASSAVTRKPSTSTPLRSAQSSRVDRRRRLRELRRLRRHHQSEDQSRERCRRRRRDANARRRFAVPRQPPPRSRDRQAADVERHAGPVVTDASSPVRSPSVRCRYGRVCQPWSALNKVVVCQLVDIVLRQELTSTAIPGRSATTSDLKRRPSGTIWNPAMTPETRERRTPPHLSPTVGDLSSLASPTSVEPGASTLLHTLLFPMAAAAADATAFVDRRRSDVSAVEADVGGRWTMSQSSSLRRRHHSAATPDAFQAQWTPPPPPSFFWYNVPPSQGNFFLLPDAAGRLPCYRWIGAAQPVAVPPTFGADGCALDYSSRTLDAGACRDAGDVDARAASKRAGVPRRRGSTPSGGSVASRLGMSARLKWVVVSKSDVSSLFESLASSMVADGSGKRTTEDPPTSPVLDRDSSAASTATVEPIKWKSTLLRRARAEAQTPKPPDSDGDVTETIHDAFHGD